MQADGVIDRYAIGGAVGALFYLEASDTEDIDIFITFRKIPGTELISLRPIYTYLKERGYAEHRKEGVVIEGWPVQFLPAVDGLGEEALAEAVSTDLDGVPARVMTSEHLVALALKAGRGKDHIRILSFIESSKLDPKRLDAVLKRHGLVEIWRDFEYKFIKGGKKP
ncbi:MAG: hypothetical protein V1929_08520 [bacterium]